VDGLGFHPPEDIVGVGDGVQSEKFLFSM
jgi:hypothetical protein